MAVQNNKAEGTVLLEMKHVKKSFDKSGVLKDISLKVREGQVVYHYRTVRFWKVYIASLCNAS